MKNRQQEEVDRSTALENDFPLKIMSKEELLKSTQDENQPLNDFKRLDNLTRPISTEKRPNDKYALLEVRNC